MTIAFAEEARDDVRQIVEYLGERSSQAADRLTDAIIKTNELLLAMPGIGEQVRLRRRKIVGLRKTPLLGFGRYMVYFTADAAHVRVVRVLHTSRDRDAILDDEP